MIIIYAAYLIKVDATTLESDFLCIAPINPGFSCLKQIAASPQSRIYPVSGDAASFLDIN